MQVYTNRARPSLSASHLASLASPRAYDYIPNMMSPIDNMVGHATDLFLAGVEPASGASYVALVLGMADKVFGNAGRSNQRESVCATHLLLR